MIHNFWFARLGERQVCKPSNDFLWHLVLVLVWFSSVLHQNDLF